MRLAWYALVALLAMSGCGGHSALRQEAPTQTASTAAPRSSADAKARLAPPASSPSAVAIAEPPTPKPASPAPSSKLPPPRKDLHPVATLVKGLQDPSSIIADDKGIFFVTWEKRRSTDVACLHQLDANGLRRRVRYCSRSAQYSNDIALSLSKRSVFLAVRTSNDDDVIVAVPRRGGAARTIASMGGGITLRADGDILFFANWRKVGAVDLRNGSVSTLHTDGAVGGLALLGGRLAYGARDGVRIADGKRKEQPFVAERWNELVASDQHVFGVDEDERVRAQPIGGGEPFTLGHTDVRAHLAYGPLTVDSRGTPYWVNLRQWCDETHDGKSLVMRYDFAEQRRVILAEVAGLCAGACGGGAAGLLHGRLRLRLRAGAR